MAENNVKIILEAVNQTKQAFSEVESQGTKAFDNLKSHWLAFAGAGAAIAGILSGLKDFVKEASEAEDIQNHLKFALESTGYTWKYAKANVDAFANSVQEMTRFSAEEASQALTNMMMYTQDLSKAQMGAKLAMDMSVRTGQDLGSTTRLIGMAMSGNVEMLGRYIPELRNLDDVLGKDATQAEKTEYTFGILQKKFGGTAQADVNTYSGALKQFQNQWSDFAKTLGNLVLPALTKVLGVMTSIFKGINEQMNKSPLKAIDEEIDVIDKAIEKMKEQAKKGFIIEENTGATIFGAEQEVLERIVILEQERQNLLEKRQQIVAQQAHDKAMLAGEIKPDVPPGGKTDPFLARYGMTVEEFNDRMSYSKLAGEAWLEAWTADVPAIEAVAKALEAAAAEEARMNPMFPDDAYNLKRMADEAERNAAAEKMRADAIERAETARVAEEGYAYETPTLKQMRDMDVRSAELAKGMQTQWTDVASQIGSAFQSGFFDLFKSGFKDLGDVARQFFENLVESAFRAFSQIATNMALFGNIKGDATSGGGLVGLLGSLFSSFIPAASGASFWTNGPTPIMAGEGGESEFVSVTPKSKMGQMIGRGGNTIQIFNVQTYSPKETQDWIRRNTGGFVKALKGHNRTAGSSKNRI